MGSERKTFETCGISLCMLFEYLIKKACPLYNRSFGQSIAVQSFQVTLDKKRRKRTKKEQVNST